MLMPILTVMTTVPAAQVAVAVESVLPKERTAAVPIRISGNQSDAVLKILETLNRHLVGSEPLPKEALVRLLDTLAKILKLPPLPQETLRDFGKRLTGFLQTLPPEARFALEKQLGQRNLSVSLRILVDVLKTSVPIDAPRLPQRLPLPTANARPLTAAPPEQTPSRTVTHGEQLSVAVRQAPLPASPFLSARSATIADPSLLQAALKKAFGDDDDGVAAPVAAEESDGEPIADPRKDDTFSKVSATRTAGSSAAAAQSQAFARATADNIPMLRAAAAFLAADPAALSQLAAIVTGEIDGRGNATREQEPGQEPGMEPGLASGLEPGMESEFEQGQDLAERPEQLLEIKNATAPLRDDFAGQDGPKRPAIDTPPAGTGTIEITLDDIGTGDKPSSANAVPAFPRQPVTRDNFYEVYGFTGHDLGEWALEADAAMMSLSSDREKQISSFEPTIEQPEKLLADTLKALVEASLPVPKGSAEGVPDSLFSALAGETADMGAQALFAELDAADEARADRALLTGDIAGGPGLVALEEDGWTTLVEGPHDRGMDRQALAHPVAMDDAAREAQLPRQPESGILGNPIPFAMIPYLPARTQETKFERVEDEEEPGFSGDEEQHGREEDGNRSKDQDANGGAHGQDEADERENGDESDRAYDLYRRMGGLG